MKRLGTILTLVVSIFLLNQCTIFAIDKNFLVHDANSLPKACQAYYTRIPAEVHVSDSMFRNLSYCSKIYDFHFYTPSHPQYSGEQSTGQSESVQKVNHDDCINAESILVFEGISQPSTSTYYSHLQQQQYHKNLRNSHNGHSHGHSHHSHYHNIMQSKHQIHGNGHAKYANHSSSSKSFLLPSKEEIKQLYASKHSDIHNKTITSEVGWLSFTIYDLVALPDEINAKEEDIALCYAGRYHTFNTTRCIYEGAFAKPSMEKTEYLGGNSYFFSMKSPDRVLLWSPVVDNGDGRYFVKIRVDDPGEYEVKLYRDHVQGCGIADCYVPETECRTYLTSDEDNRRCSESNICMREVANMTMLIEGSDKWPLWKKPVRITNKHTSSSNNDSRLPPACPADEIGIVSGRWVSPKVLLSPLYNFTEAHIFGDLDWPYVWMPYDCYIPAMPVTCRRSCIDSHKLAFSGLSRERTNSFDVLDFLGHNVPYRKVREALILGENYYFPVYYQQLTDRVSWNLDDYYMNVTIDVTVFDLNDYKLCNLTAETKADPKYSHKPLAFLASEESWWYSTSSHKAKWPHLSGFFHKNLVSFCARDNVTFVYKTSVPVSLQNRVQSWEKFMQASRTSAKIAVSYGMKVVDAFMVTMPFLHDKSVLPDGVHVYTSYGSMKGNYVSKTVTLMFLRLLCPHCSAENRR